MAGTEDDAGMSRRSVLRRATGVAGFGIGLAGVADATPTSGGRATASRGSRTRTDPYEGFVCGAALSDGDAFTVEPRCDDGCEVIRATGLTPECSGGTEDLYVNLHGTDPTVWVTPTDRRVGSIAPGAYRVVGAEPCGGDAPACDGEDLYRVRFRSEGGAG